MPKKTSGKRVSSKKKNPLFAFKTKKLPTSNIQTFLGIVFIVLGFVFLYKLPISSQEVQSKEPIHASKEFKDDGKELKVARILLPKSEIDLEVKPSKIVGGYWEVSETGASQGEGTANPGTGGNVVIFAHAREGMFKNLEKTKTGEIIYVFTKTGWYRYKVSEIQKVYPKDIATVAPTKDEVLTLFTCSGFFDEKRLIVKAKPIKN